eukprot:GEMP01012942.1.p1 GENE.GEMP01012942.1~~GEMP01012942.1.p1  ORF type:complete len:554 (+),score=123.27 GEMP01012942.1:937-2598(+)
MYSIVLYALAQAVFSVTCSDLPLVPWPQECYFPENRNQFFVLPEKTDFDITYVSGAVGEDSGTPQILENAFQWTKDQIYVHEGSIQTGHPHPVLAKLEVKVKDAHAALGPHTNERYALVIGEDGTAVLTADTQFGALHGLQTFSQLAKFSHSQQGKVTYSVPFVNITDQPRFPHRGLLIDTSRHYLSVHTIQQIIDELATVKANVLHWHITDIQSWPIGSDADDLWEGEYSEGEIYTKEDAKKIVVYAATRGIRVIPEFDMPGHSKSWSHAHPELFPEGCNDALAPKKETYTFVKKLLTSYYTQGIFIDQHLHLGADEVPMECWKNIAHERKKTLLALFSEWLAAVRDISMELNRTVTWWDEAALESDPPPQSDNMIIQVWRDWEYTKKIIDMGYDVIVSPSPWYLDHLDVDIDGAYGLDVEALGTERLKKVIGGEGCMWGESVDQSNAIARIFPRYAGIAERLWTRTKESDKKKLHARLAKFRCIMLLRGAEYGTLNLIGDTAGGPSHPASCEEIYVNKDLEWRSAEIHLHGPRAVNRAVNVPILPLPLVFS